MDIVISAGGIISRIFYGEFQILCVTTKDNLLALPKGHVKLKESLESAAIREVKEEIGLMSASIVQKLDVVEREGTEPDGSKIKKQITYFIMDGSNYTYVNEENYVWIEFNLAAEIMNHSEEKEMLLRNKKTIFKYPSHYFTSLIPLSDYDNFLSHSDILTKNEDLLNQATSYLDGDDIVVLAGIPRETELKVFSAAAKVVCIPPAGWSKNRLIGEINDNCAFTGHALDNIIDQDLPNKISLFYTHFSLNLSDIKTFFFVNQLLKKMRNNAKILIEGRGIHDNVIKKGKSIGPNIVLIDKQIVRVWNIDFVNEKLVSKLGLLLLSHKVNSKVKKGFFYESNQFIFEKQGKQIF